MLEFCREYLKAKLADAGIETLVFTTWKDLKATQESHLGAVLFDSEALVRNGSKKLFTNKQGIRCKRTKVFDRASTLKVVIGEYCLEAAEAIFTKFLAILDKGLMINGNYAPIEIEEVDWVEKEDSILQAKVAVEFKVRFDGCIFVDKEMISMAGKDISISVQKEK